MAVAHGVPALAEPVVPVRRALDRAALRRQPRPLDGLLHAGPGAAARADRGPGHGHKEIWLGLVTGVGAVVAVIVNPLAGALSDRTRPRLLGRAYGRRHVWTLGGALLSAPLAARALGRAQPARGHRSAGRVAQVGLNVMLATLTAAVPDRVPVSQRGLVSGWIGMPQALGLVMGAILVTAVVTTPGRRLSAA